MTKKTTLTKEKIVTQCERVLEKTRRLCPAVRSQTLLQINRILTTEARQFNDENPYLLLEARKEFLEEFPDAR